jgi:type IV pilus assembly protein PilV
MVKKSMSGQKGFTLLEVMIAVFLLAVAIMGAASVTTLVIKSNSLSQTLTMATTLAKDKMEELKVSTYNAATQADPKWTGTDYWKADGTFLEFPTGSYYIRSWTAPGTKTKIITITVAWPTNRTVQLQTIRASD